MASDNRGNIEMDQRENCNIECCDEVIGRRLAEQRLSEQERRYRDIFHNISDAIYLLEVTEDGRFRYLETNRIFEQHAGVRENGLLGTYVGDFLSSSGAEAVAEKVIACLRRCMEAGCSIEEEMTEDFPSGQRICLATLYPLFDDAGRVDRILGISRDITERKRAEQQNGFMKFALDHAHDAVFLVDSQAGFRFRYVNDKACQSLGYSREELLAMRVPDIDPHVDFEAAGKIDELIRKQPFTRFETSHKAQDGRIFPVEIGAVNFEYDGQTMGLSIVRDISERKRMEAEAQRNLRFFESMDRVNLAIQGSNDLETVLNNVLEIVLSIFDCDRAFLVYPCDPDADSWRVPFEKTRPEYPGALALDLVMTMDAYVASKFRILLDADGPVTYGLGNQHPLPEDMSGQFGFKAFISTALYPNDDKPWEFGIHQCSRTRVWTADEVKLIQEIGRRLSDALTGLLAFRNLQERERQFRTLAESLPDYIARYDSQARKIYANVKLQQLLGGHIEAWLGKTPKEANPNGEYDEYQAKLEGVIKTGQPDEMERLLPDGEGDLHYFQIRFVAELGTYGEIIGALAIGRDVTRTRQLERELTKREQEFRSLAENSPDIIVRYDRDCRRIYLNRAYEESLNTTPAEALGKTPGEYWRLATPDADEYTEILRRVMETRLPEWVAVRLFDATGELRYRSMHVVPELTENNEVTSVLSVSTDITELKIAEQRRMDDREAERKMLARELHDDLGQRLSVLRMDTFRLGLRFGKDNPALMAQVQGMESEVAEVLQVIRNLATLLRPAALDLGLVPALQGLVDHFCLRSDIEVICQLAQQDIALDERQSMAIYRIVQESLTNVLKHAQAKRATISLERRGKAYVLEICDDGKGFVPISATKTDSFGLRGIEERVKLLGGKLAVETSSRCGTKLTIHIPAVQLANQELVCAGGILGVSA